MINESKGMKCLRCVICNKKFHIDSESYFCGNCKSIHKMKYGHLIVDYDYKKFSDLPLPVKPFSIGEGNTPLIRTKLFGMNNVFLKNETLNPTGSFKDRSTSIMIAQALKLNKKTVCCASSGSAAVSLSAYSYKAGIQCNIFVPKKTSEEKLSIIQIFKAKINYVDGVFEDAYQKMNETISKSGWYNCSVGINPFAIEGYKMISYEIFKQIGIPDKVIVPVGDGTNLSGIWKGFKELKLLGYTDKLPSMISVQIKDADPVTKAFRNGKLIETIEKPIDSIAEGIVAKESYNIIHTVKALKESKGSAVSVTDEKIIDGLKILLKEGILVEPTSASVIAGLNKSLKENKINRSEKVVCLLTGSGFKTLTKIKEIVK